MVPMGRTTGNQGDPLKKCLQNFLYSPQQFSNSKKKNPYFYMLPPLKKYEFNLSLVLF